MRDQLIRYVDLLFAGAEHCNDIKQEILQNTLDRYDDLVAQGKTPQAAYSLAISGIGDVSELLGRAETVPAVVSHKEQKADVPAWKKILRAVAVCLYILSIIPLIVLSEMGMDVLGLCGTLAIVAIATAAIMIASSGNIKDDQDTAPMTPKQELQKAAGSVINTVGLVAYFAVSFMTQAWYITWLIFPIMAAVRGLVNACIDLKGAN